MKRQRGIASYFAPCVKKSVPIHIDEPRPDDHRGADRDDEEDPASGSLSAYSDSNEENSGVHESNPSSSLSSQQLKE